MPEPTEKLGWDSFHPAVRGWFEETFDRPTSTQLEGWRAVSAGRSVLVAAPTGSGKTLAAFLAAIDELAKRAERRELEDGVQIVYVSPLRALSNDIRRNLEAPLEAINARLRAGGIQQELTAGLRTGDTTSSERSRMTRKPPHILVTTPESLYILLGSDGGRGMLRSAGTVIVDEIHAVAPDKRGAHLSLTLERLEELAARPLVRVGLSATQKPIELVADFLTGARRPRAHIVDAGLAREIDLSVEVTGSPLTPVMSAEHMDEVYDRLAELVAGHRTTLVFANTRRETERLVKNLGERIGRDLVSSHHGSMSRERRFEAEQGLKSGELRAIVATASLELGIDIGHVDLVCQVGSVRAIGTLVQRIGRSGHHVGGTPKGRIFPLTLDELVESTALVDAVRRGELDTVTLYESPLDILAQHVVAAVGARDWEESELFEVVRGSFSFRDLTRERFEEVLEMLADGYATRRGRRSALIHWDQINGRIRARRGTRLVALTSGGAIPERADYRVVLDHDETVVGTLDEDFAIESMPGDVFQLGNSSWMIARVDSRRGQVRVHDARGKPPSIPFWFGEAPGRTHELSIAVSRVRNEVDRRLRTDAEGNVDVSDAIAWARSDVGLDDSCAEQLVGYLATAREALGAMPTREKIVVERFFDEAGNTHLVLHSPHGSRLNRAWGLALRKRFCRQFNFELQAAANEDSVILSMGPTHSFPLEEVFDFLNPRVVRTVLIQALLDSPMFGTRWRWNLNRSLAVPRFRGGRKNPPQLQRMQAEDFLAVVFPDQLACLENIAGDREVPDHPMVDQTIEDCLREAMDVEQLEAVLEGIETGEVVTLARDLREPSPLAHQIINARPYAYLDDAPLEERRTQAILTRGLLDPNLVGDLAALDTAAVDAVRDESRLDARDADELHDAIVCRGYLTDEEIPTDLEPKVRALVQQRRIGRVERGRGLWVAAERSLEMRAAFPDSEVSVQPPARFADAAWTQHQGLTELLRSRLEYLPAVTARRFADELGVDLATVEATLMGLEAQGFVFRGHFDIRLAEEQWCERGLLARIHRYTLARLRREIEPVTPADFMRFLFEWQHVASESQMRGPDGLAKVLEQLSGVDAAAGAWETEILPARVEHYDPTWLDMACLSGRFSWGRIRGGGGGRSPMRSSPIAVMLRDEVALFSEPRSEPDLSAPARKVASVLDEHGAAFFGDLVSRSGTLKSRVEEGLGELVASGVVTADSFSGLRALLVPTNKRPKFGRMASLVGSYSVENAGRWSFFERRGPEALSDDELERVARRLLDRWGVVFRALTSHETQLPWRKLAQCYRAMEARGEVRGGRFVNGFVGEQYALPEAVGKLRSVRRLGPTGELVAINGCDPLNLTGVVVGDGRVNAVATNRVVYRDGVPVAAIEGGDLRRFTDEPIEHLDRIARRVPGAPRVRSYMQS